MIDLELYKTAANTVEFLKSHNITLSTAESCTGGMISSYITAVPGASQIFGLGIVSYTCKIKNKVLGVDAETLAAFGAVSEQTAREMAEKVRLKGGADIGAAVTGVAGPDGSEGHPPGYVFIAVSGDRGAEAKLLNIEPKDRNFVRESAAKAVLELIKSYAEVTVNG